MTDPLTDDEWEMLEAILDDTTIWLDIEGDSEAESKLNGIKAKLEQLKSATNTFINSQEKG